MKRLAALAAVLLFATGLLASEQDGSIKAFIEAALPESAAPGIAYARIDNEEIVAEGHGETVKSKGTRVTSATLFPIGSVTKSFTALAIMQLAETGALEIDDPVAQHLVSFASGRGRDITLRQLLNHTSGYTTVQGNAHHAEGDASRLGLIEYAERLAQLEPGHEPGTVWEYSNANYQILGAVIEQVSGEDYADYIRARIFQPLGMNDSRVQLGPPSPDAATGHRPWFGSVRAYPGDAGQRINAPAGGIVASARDMGTYLAMWASDADDIVSAETKALMTSPSGPASPAYGLGWSIDAENGTVFHTGLVPGVEALASFNRQSGKGVAVMVNANGGIGFADTWYLIGGVGARAMGQPHADDGSRWGPKFAYLSIALLPPLFLILNAHALWARSRLRAKRASTAGRFSLWILPVAIGGLSWFLIALLPRLFGGSLATLQLYQPDFAWCLIAAAILGPAWAVLRLIIAYWGSFGRPSAA